MQKMKYENKQKRSHWIVKVRGETVTLVWDGGDWIIEKKKASQRVPKDGE